MGRVRKQPKWTVALAELDFEFMKVNDDGTWQVKDVPMPESQGCTFICPVCFLKSQREGRDGKGAHMIVCWFRNPPNGVPIGDELPPGPGRWWVEGINPGNLTFNYGEPRQPKSVLMMGGCKAHFYVDKGRCVDADN